jgi:hypothetical protein
VIIRLADLVLVTHTEADQTSFLKEALHTLAENSRKPGLSHFAPNLLCLLRLVCDAFAPVITTV